MDSKALIIPPEIEAEYKRMVVAANQPAPTKPLKTIQRVVEKIQPLEKREWYGLLDREQNALFYPEGTCVFEVHDDGLALTVTKVHSAKDLKAERACLRKKAQEDQQKAFRAVVLLANGVRKLPIRKEKLYVPNPKGGAIVPLDCSKVIFTKHAIKRLAMYFWGSDKDDLAASAIKILGRAHERNAISVKYRKIRADGRHKRPARYFLSDGLRFVVVEERGRFLVLTIEHVDKP